jgi:hypothetical protein
VAGSDTRTLPSASNEATSLRNILGGALFYIGIPAATLYPLGFMALSLQLWRDPDFPYNWAVSGLDFSMIWYAASLVPKVIVIGIGVRLLLLSVVSTVLSMCIASATLLLLQRWKLAKSWSTGEGQDDDTAGYILSRWEDLNKWERRFWYLSLLVLLPLVMLWLWSEFPLDHWYDLPFLGGYFTFSALGGVVLGYIRFWGYYRWMHHGVVLAFVGSIFAGLCLSALELPRDLPYVELQASRSWPESLPSGSRYRFLGSDPNNLNIYNRENGILTISSHPSSQTGQSITRYWDEPKRPPVNINSKDNRLNRDSDATQ